MWPFYFLFNKMLNAQQQQEDDEDDMDHVDILDGHHLSSGGCHPTKGSSITINSLDAVLPASRFIQVPHINQLHSWDCGLACVMMALYAIGIQNCSIEALADLCSTTSVWTVDLAFLLQKFSVKFSYFTVTLGVNPNYSVEKFYKEQLPADLLRVDTLFQKALDEGINIQCRSINEREISHLILSGKYIAIALVDLYKLSRSWLEDMIVTGMTGGNLGYTGLPQTDGPTTFLVIGHYVVICGYDASADEFEIRDPASSRKHERISSKCLKEARKSFGTDEDLLLISLDKSNNRECCLVQHQQHLKTSE